MDRTTMGSFLAALRRSAGLTQRELAEKLNVSDKAVSRWERDESAPDLTLIPVIAEIFGVTSDELLRGGRASPSRNANRETAKTELQIQNLLTRAQTHYQIHCLISVTVALLGLIAALAVNLGFLRAYVAFFAGCAPISGCNCLPGDFSDSGPQQHPCAIASGLPGRSPKEKTIPGRRSCFRNSLCADVGLPASDCLPGWPLLRPDPEKLAFLWQSFRERRCRYLADRLCRCEPKERLLEQA